MTESGHHAELGKTRPQTEKQSGASLWRRLDEVLVTEELTKRPSRLPDPRVEQCAIAALVEVQGNEPQVIMQRLADVLMISCEADSAGISVLTGEGAHERFVWPAIAGKFAVNVGGGMARCASPCGVVIDQRRALLFQRPELHFPYQGISEPPIVEALLAPFYIDDKPRGTVWVVAHTPQRKFDLDDARLLTRLTEFAAGAVERLDAPILTRHGRQEAAAMPKSRAPDRPPRPR